jgi:hypothetical protein
MKRWLEEYAEIAFIAFCMTGMGLGALLFVAMFLFILCGVPMWAVRWGLGL